MINKTAILSKDFFSCLLNVVSTAKKHSVNCYYIFGNYNQASREASFTLPNSATNRH